MVRDVDAPGEAQTHSPRLEADAVASLYREYAEELRCFLLGVLCNLDLANEVLQITFANTVELGHTARDESVKGWLFRVAYNEAMTLRRRQQVRTKAAIKLAEVPPKFEAAADELLTRSETVTEVRAAVERLPQELQRIVRLRMYEEKTFAAIASELKLPLGTVYARMQQALKALKERLS